MPSSHQRYAKWTPKRIQNWALESGEHCRNAVERIMTDRPHPEQGFRSCIGLIALAGRFGEDRLDAACQRAVAFNTVSYQSIKAMLETNRDKIPLSDDQDLPMDVDNKKNVRGSAYYA